MYGERSDNESQKVGQEEQSKTMTEEKIRAKAKEEAEKEQREAEEKTQTMGEIWDVVFHRVFSVQMFKNDAKKLATEIIRQVGDVEVHISAYEWNFQTKKVYAKVEISKAVYSQICTKDLPDLEIHAVDEISFGTIEARTRKK